MNLNTWLEIFVALFFASLDMAPPILLAATIVLFMVNHWNNHKNDKK